MFERKLKAFEISKGAGKFVSRLFTFGSNHKSLDWLTSELFNLRHNSIKNNIDGVNKSVKTLLSSFEFWVYCYCTIKRNSNLHSLAKSSSGAKNLELDGMNLEFFKSLAKTIKSGRFQFSLFRKDHILKCRDENCQIGFKSRHNWIVQKGMCIILEQVSEHQFYECCFGQNRSVYDILNYIRW